MSASLLFETTQACIAHDLLEPWSAARLGLRTRDRSQRTCLRGSDSACLLIAAVPEETQCVQQLLVFVKQTANREADVVGFVACPLAP